MSSAADRSDRDRADFERELLPHLQPLLAVAQRLTRSRTEAEDLLQDTCVKAFRSRDQYRPGTNLRAWLFAILRNTFLNGYRRRVLERRVLDGPDAATLSSGWLSAATLSALRDPAAGGLDPTFERPILEALDELPDEFRLVVMLADVEELSYREIAETLGCPIGTVMSRLHRGRRALRSRLIDHARAIGLVATSDASPQDDDGEVPAKRPVNLNRYRAKKEVG